MESDKKSDERKDWLQYGYASFIKDIPLILIIMVILSLAAALDPVSGVEFHFAKVVFVFAILKSFSIGVFFALISFGKKTLKWFYVILNLLFFEMCLYLVIQFNVRITPNVMTLVLQTNTTEAKEFFYSYFPLSTIVPMVLFAVGILVSYYLCDSFWKKRLTVKFGGYKFILAAIAMIFTFSAYTNTLVDTRFADGKRPEKYVISPILYSTTFPHQDLYLALLAISGNEEKVEKIYNANKEVVVDSCEYSSPNIVFVVGESYIKSHSSLFGYNHQTNPLLEKEMKSGNLFVFDDVLSHSSGTNVCMQYFYSTKSVDDNNIWEEQPLFPAIFKKAGYYVSLVDNQNSRYTGSAGLDYTTSFFINPLNIHNQCFDYRNENVYKYDLQLIESEIKRIKAVKSNHTMNIFHLYGQHVDASGRFPHEKCYEYFSADSIHRADLKNDVAKRQAIADYDNATRYNDLVLSKILDLYRDKDAVLVYVSDHGECIYDDSALTYGRAISEKKADETIKLLYEVPMVVWCSNSYKTNHPEMVNRIMESRNKPFMHDDMCHVLFDLAGISGNFYHPERSVINDKYIPRKRIVGKKYDYDSIKSKMSKIKLRNINN